MNINDGWQSTEEVIFTGAVYLSDTPGEVTHFLCAFKTSCGIPVTNFLPASNSIITCTECNKYVVYGKPGELTF
ncbi:hypothetical protein [Tolypothrix sp. PCC 7910]|uniref:hypothetical protein n=1 Tax=Tolypothrix sp. PCC 7910 TaxID=2099387 RepID=UPI0014303B74|nr:hypothetical protein [Tolypothrix sp. PCC 7910]